MVASDSDEEDNKGRTIGFFFGNVDEDGHLEEDYLDEDAKEQLAALTELNIGDEFDKITSGDPMGDQDGPQGTGEGPTEKAPDAIDYADEMEMMDDPDAPEPPLQPPVFAMALPLPKTAEDDYDEDPAMPNQAPSGAPSGTAAPLPMFPALRPLTQGAPQALPEQAPQSAPRPGAFPLHAGAPAEPDQRGALPAQAMGGLGAERPPGVASLAPGGSVQQVPGGNAGAVPQSTTSTSVVPAGTSGTTGLPVGTAGVPGGPSGAPGGATVQPGGTGGAPSRTGGASEESEGDVEVIEILDEGTDETVEAPSARQIWQLQRQWEDQLARALEAGVELPFLAHGRETPLLRMSDLFAEEQEGRGEAAGRSRMRTPRRPIRAAPSASLQRLAPGEEEAKGGEEEALGDAGFLSAAPAEPAEDWSSDESEPEPDQDTGDVAGRASGRPERAPVPPAAELGREEAVPVQPVPQGPGKPLAKTPGSLGKPGGDLSFPSLPASNHELVSLTEWQADIFWGTEGDPGSPDQDMRGELPEEEEEEEGNRQEAMEVQQGGVVEAGGFPTNEMEWLALGGIGTGPVLPDQAIVTAPELVLAAHVVLEPIQRPSAAHSGEKPPKWDAQMLRLEAGPWGPDPEPAQPAAANPAPDQASGQGAGDGDAPQTDATGGPQDAAVRQPSRSQALQLWSRTTLPDGAIVQLDGGWLDNIIWDPGDLSKSGKQAVQALAELDLNNPRLVFEISAGVDPGTLLERAAADIIVCEPVPEPVLAPLVGTGAGARQLARFNISLDASYTVTAQKKGDKGLGSVYCRHATPALSLSTLPLAASPDEIRHRPRGVWLPPPITVPARGNASKSHLLLSSLVGFGKEALKTHFNLVSLNAVTTANVCLAVSGKFGSVESQKPAMWLRGAVPRRLPIQEGLSLREAGAEPTLHVELAFVFSEVQPLPTASANVVPDPASGAPMKPPGAFTKRKDLTSKQGHTLLIEYVEEHPLLLGRPGMGLYLETFYKKTDDLDNAYNKLSSVGEGERWRVGHVEPLPPGDLSPFSLGALPPGQRQLAAECNMYIAPAFPYAPRWSDFLLVRSATGALSLREITGTLVLGQQEPHLPVPAPASRECRDIEERRMIAYVNRELRKQQARIAKMPEKKTTPVPSISVSDLRRLFPQLPDNLIRQRLKDRCECQPRYEKEKEDDIFYLRPGGQIAVEGELRKVITPDQWCTHEAMEAGMHRFEELGLQQLDRLAAIPIERLKTAAEQLPPSADGRVEAAAQAILVALQTAPWLLSDNFLQVYREGKGVLQLTGVGDPTQKGRGFSYIRDSRRSAAMDGPAIAKREAGAHWGDCR
eukprot:jgi/Botrbrau1/7853/Bobra.9_2s0029.1